VKAPLAEAHDTFRNELASVARDGRRRWIYARQPHGRLYTARTAVAVCLLAFLFLAPFVTVGGQPLMRLDVLHRHFVLLGVVFWPQDFHIVVLIALTALVTLMISTVVVGRIWCGWLCPQTIFMEMVFRRLEYFIEGSAEQTALAVSEGQRVATVAYESYQRMLDAGIAREVARMVLPLSIYSSMYVTVNARSLMNFLSLRTKHPESTFPSFPQREIELVAEQMESAWATLMPLTHAAFAQNGRVAP